MIRSKRAAKWLIGSGVIAFAVMGLMTFLWMPMLSVSAQTEGGGGVSPTPTPPPGGNDPLDDPDPGTPRVTIDVIAGTPGLEDETTPGARGTVMLSAEAMEERLRGQLERGELTMWKIRADYARYCE